MKLYRIDIGYPDSENDTSLSLREYKVLRKTPKGYWIEYPNKKGEKFVLEHRKGDKYRPAYISIEKAVEAAMHRANSFRKWSKWNVKRAEKAIKAIEQGNDFRVLEAIKTQKYINLDALNLKLQNEN